MKKYCLGFGLLLTGLFLVGCDKPESGRRLRLPKGSPEAGQAAFIALKCTECHSVAGVALQKPTIAPNLVVELGGNVPRLRMVGDLVTSIIHPTQSVSFKMKRPAVGRPVSSMPTINDVMTVAQMVET